MPRTRRSVVNVARVKGFTLAYLLVIHFETSRFNIKSFARVLLLFFRSFPLHLENYPECISRTIGWARGPWEDTIYQYLLGNFKDGERSWLSMLKLYLKQSFIQLRAKCNKSLWIMPGLWLPVWLQCRPYRMSRWTNVYKSLVDPSPLGKPQSRWSFYKNAKQERYISDNS